MVLHQRGVFGLFLGHAVSTSIAGQERCHKGDIVGAGPPQYEVHEQGRSGPQSPALGRVQHPLPEERVQGCAEQQGHRGIGQQLGVGAEQGVQAIGHGTGGSE